MPDSTTDFPKDSLRQIFDYVIKRDAREKGFRDSITDMYEQNAKWSGVIFRFFVSFIGFFIKPHAKSVQYFFWGIKFEELILSLPKSETCVVGGPKQLLFCLKNGITFIPEMRLWQPLHRELKTGAVFDSDDRLTSIISFLVSKLSKCSTKDSVFIVDNDSLPAQRVAIQAARVAGIKQNICIQDGIFQHQSPGYILHGWYADRFFVMSKSQKRLLVEKGMPAKKISIMGFHSSPYIPERSLSSSQCRKVCLIGQPWGKYGKEKETRYLHILRTVVNSLQSVGCPVYFKPHPWERGSHYLKGLSNIVDVSMAEALEQYDVFVSLTSTALFEATASGRIAVQVVDPAFEADRFSEISEINSINFDSIDFEYSLNEAVITDKPLVISHPLPLVQRFKEAISEK